jgi:hypothetical protein
MNQSQGSAISIKISKGVVGTVKSIRKHFRASRGLVLEARFEVLARFQNLPWRQRAKAVRTLMELLEPIPSLMEEAAEKRKPYSPDSLETRWFRDGERRATRSDRGVWL